MTIQEDNIYLELTREFNKERVRAIISSGQAVVLHRLAIMSKDGDWIVREDPADLGHVLGVLERRGAAYRFGAPLDAQWLAGGWSSHFEFASGGLRVRCDFFSRPPRVDSAGLTGVWAGAAGQELPFLNAETLVAVKQTQREKDYAVIGELARKLPPELQLLHGRSAKDLIALAAADEGLTRGLETRRPLLAHALAGDRDSLEEALDKERRLLMRADEERLAAYAKASGAWRTVWPTLDLQGLPLRAAHRRILQEAGRVLPYCP